MASDPFSAHATDADDETWPTASHHHAAHGPAKDTTTAKEFSAPRTPTAPKPLDLGAFLSVVTLFPFIFGLVYSRFYFQRLGFPAESLDLSTAFFLLRSFDPIMFALIMLLQFGWIFLPVSFWQGLPIFQRASTAKLGWRMLIFIVLPLVISMAASRFLMEQFGFEAFGTGDWADWLLIVAVILVVAFYLFMKFVRLGPQSANLDPSDWRQSDALLRMARYAAMLALLCYAVATGIGFGRWEAQRLLEGRSPKSTLVTLTMRAAPDDPLEPQLLIVYMQGLYYVTPMIEPAPQHPVITVYSGSDVLSATMSRPNTPAT